MSCYVAPAQPGATLRTGAAGVRIAVNSRITLRCTEELVERVQFSGWPGVGTGPIDVALRGDHRLVAEKLHEGVDADIRVSEFGGEGYLYLFLRKRLLFTISRCPTREAREGA